LKEREASWWAKPSACPGRRNRLPHRRPEGTFPTVIDLRIVQPKRRISTAAHQNPFGASPLRRPEADAAAPPGLAAGTSCAPGSSAATHRQPHPTWKATVQSGA
jgi:hypothetical protein